MARGYLLKTYPLDGGAWKLHPCAQEMFGTDCMRSSVVTSAIAAVGSFILAATAEPARADWLRAESDRFIVYSDGGERALRDYVQKLEIFDRVMQVRHGGSMSDEPQRKMPIYLVGGRRGLTRVHPQSGENTMGTYFPSEDDIFAVAIRGDGDGGMEAYT